MKQELFKNGLYNALAGVARLGVTVLAVPLLIRALGIETYGLWTLISAVVGLVTLAEVGLSVSTTVFVSQDLGQNDGQSLSQTLTTTFSAIALVSIGVTMALGFGAESIARSFTPLSTAQHDRVTPALQLGAFVVAAKLWQQVFVGIEQAYQQYKALNAINTAQSIALNVGCVTIAALGGNVEELMQWQAVTAGVGVLWHGWTVRSLVATQFSVCWNRQRSWEIARYSVTTWLTALGGMLFFRGDRLIVGAMLGVQSVGIYAAMTDLAATINQLSALPVQPLLPALTTLRSSAESSVELAWQTLKQALAVNTIGALGLGSVGIAIAPIALRWMLGDGATDANVQIFRGVLLIYTLYSLNAVGYFVLFSVNAVRQNMLIHLGSGVLSLLLIALGAAQCDLAGAALGNVGYLNVGWLTIEAMRQMAVPASVWTAWIRFPVGSVVGLAAIAIGVHQFALQNASFQPGLGFGMAIAGVQLGLLLKWFFDQQEEAAVLHPPAQQQHFWIRK